MNDTTDKTSEAIDAIKSFDIAVSEVTKAVNSQRNGPSQKAMKTYKEAAGRLFTLITGTTATQEQLSSIMEW